MKRKHPTSSGAAKPKQATSPSLAPRPPTKSVAEPKKKPAPATKSATPKKSAPAPAPKFAQPMKRLEQLDDDSEDEEQDEESARHDRKHMDEIDQELDGSVDEEDEDDDDEDEGMDQEEAELDEADNKESINADDIDMDKENGEDGDDDVEALEADEAEEEDETPLEYDLPIRLVLGTNEGGVFGLKSKQTLRQLRAYHNKLSSKRGIEETDIKQDDDDEDDEEDEEMADDEKIDSSNPTLPPKPSASTIPPMSLLFTNSGHIGSLKSIAVSSDGKWMVSGGADEIIKIYKTAIMREFGQLHSHTGSVTSLEFYGNSFLLSGGQEGDLCIWSTKTWQLLRKFTEAHVGSAGPFGGVSCLSVHPSGRVALSVGGTDRKVKLWDLMKGTMASERKLDFVCTGVRWSPNGETYALMGEKRLDINDTASKLLRREEITETKLLTITWLSNTLIALGCEDKTIRIHSSISGECVSSLQAHQARVRGLDTITVAQSHNSTDKKCTFVASASTDGQTFVWDVTPIVDAFATSSSPSTILHAIHPCCSSFHDHRVTILRILPQWIARKEDTALMKPVQTAAAQERQAGVEAKKQSASYSNKSMTKSERESANLAKSKKLFEKKQRSLAAKEAAAAKAKRTLARLAPGADLAEDGASTAAQPKKKTKPEFEEAPLVDSDQEQEMKNGGFDEDDDDEENEPPRKVAKSTPAATIKSSTTAAKPAKPTPPPTKSTQPSAKSNKPTPTPASTSTKKPSSATSTPSAADSTSTNDHAGFSASIPLFKPQLNNPLRKKKKSARKIERDAARSKSLGQRKF